MKVGLLGKKIGMTRVYDATVSATPVTVIEAGGNSLLQTKTAEKDGYQAIQVGFDTQKESRLPKPLLGHFKKAEAEPKKFVREFRLPDGTQIEGELNLAVPQFEAGQFSQLARPAKGKGFSCVGKKDRIAGQPARTAPKLHPPNPTRADPVKPDRVTH